MNNVINISLAYYHLGWDPSLMNRIEQEAKRFVWQCWQVVYDDISMSHAMTVLMANCLFTQGQQNAGNGSGHHGSPGGGGSVEVKSLGDGKYKVVNGLYDGGNTVYIVDDQGNRTGEILGHTLTPITFYNVDGSLAKGSIIDMADYSGQDFWYDFIANTPSLKVYSLDMYDGYKNDDYNSIYDFKKHGENSYRSMQIDFGFGPYICTARDIGNFAAGYLCGIKALTHNDTRIVFDLFHMLTNNSFKGEPPVSRLAQDIGYYWGAYNFYIKLFK